MHGQPQWHLQRDARLKRANAAGNQMDRFEGEIGNDADVATLADKLNLIGIHLRVCWSLCWLPGDGLEAAAKEHKDEEFFFLCLQSQNLRRVDRDRRRVQNKPHILLAGNHP